MQKNIDRNTLCLCARHRCGFFDRCQTERNRHSYLHLKFKLCLYRYQVPALPEPLANGLRRQTVPDWEPLDLAQHPFGGGVSPRIPARQRRQSPGGNQKAPRPKQRRRPARSRLQLGRTASPLSR